LSFVTSSMCLVLVGLYRLAPKVLGALKIAQPETIVGMAPVLEPIGAGNYDRARAGHRSSRVFVSSLWG
jgi:hypothetical protein